MRPAVGFPIQVVVKLHTATVRKLDDGRYLPSATYPGPMAIPEVSFLFTLPSPTSHATKARVESRVPTRLTRLVAAVNYVHPRSELKRLVNERAERISRHRLDVHPQSTSKSSRPSSARSPVTSMRRFSSSAMSCFKASRTNSPLTVCSSRIDSRSYAT